MVKHGLSRHRNYRSWYMMRKRCNDPFFDQYDRCGRFGIQVCKEWDNDHSGLESFINDMGDRPEGGILHRLDKSLSYNKDNCRWASIGYHNRNKSANIMLEHENEIKCLSEWSKDMKVSFQTMKYRINRGYPSAVVLGIMPIKQYNAS